MTNTPKASTNATADLTIGLILSVARRIVEGDELSRTKGFDGWAPLFSVEEKFQARQLELLV